ncbi:MAG: hypothetical protein MJ247_03515 [Alphaproteobacteria bacterium]|nr:hypothetical protein [Alphaproteobacteria bacterium]
MDNLSPVTLTIYLIISSVFLIILAIYTDNKTANKKARCKAIEQSIQDIASIQKKFSNEQYDDTEKKEEKTNPTSAKASSNNEEHKTEASNKNSKWNSFSRDNKDWNDYDEVIHNFDWDDD